jgi:large subunit ribosomal protein L25
MKEIELVLSKREILGKKVRHLRRQGMTPVHLFGPTTKSVALQGDTEVLEKMLKEESKVALISLKIETEKRAKHVIIREIQRNTMTRQLLHIDFYQVKMTELVKMEVPVVLVGEAPATKITGNMLEHELNTISVESLPSQLPAGIELDISSLTQGGQALRVKDLVPVDGVSILNQPEQVIVKITVPRLRKEDQLESTSTEEKAPAEPDAPGKESPAER